MTANDTIATRIRTRALRCFASEAARPALRDIRGATTGAAFGSIMVVAPISPCKRPQALGLLRARLMTGDAIIATRIREPEFSSSGNAAGRPALKEKLGDLTIAASGWIAAVVGISRLRLVPTVIQATTTCPVPRKTSPALPKTASVTIVMQ